MFAITKNERDRLAYVKKVRQLLSEKFSLREGDVTEQNSIWGSWLSLKQQEPRDLLELVKGDVKDVFKARALTIILAPRIRFAPFAWNDDTSLNDYLFLTNGIVLSELSPQLRIFAFELLKHNIDTVLALNADKQLTRTLSCFNRYILEALTLLREDDPMAIDLFDRYQINDLVEYSGVDDASGYNPFRDILNSPKIPEKWKRLADEKMRLVIRAEQKGYAQPRKGWKKVLTCYTNHICCHFNKKPPPYSAELFVSQIDFVLSLPCVKGHELLHSIHLPQIMRILAGENHKELRYRLARRLILEDSGYTILREDDLIAVYMIRKEFADIDPELRDCLDRILVEGEERQENNRRRASSKMEQANLVMTLMR